MPYSIEVWHSTVQLLQRCHRAVACSAGGLPTNWEINPEYLSAAEV